MATKFMGLLGNNTGADIGGIFEDAIRTANGGPLPEEIADLFTVAVYKIPDADRQEVDRGEGHRLIVTMKDD